MQKQDSDNNESEKSHESEAFQSTEEMVGAIEESIKMVKEERKNLVHRNSSTMPEFGKDSVFGMQQEAKMEETITSSCSLINHMLEECGLQPIETVIYPQFCKMLNAEQLKDAIKSIISMQQTNTGESEKYQQAMNNANEHIKQLEEENQKLIDQSAQEKSKSYDDMNNYYSTQINSLSNTLQKYKSALENELSKEKYTKEAVIPSYRKY